MMTLAGMPAPGDTITMEEAGRSIAQLAAIVRSFPTGQAKPVTITLTDEEWVAVTAALGVVITHAASEGAPPIFPGWIDPAQRKALSTIYNTNLEAARNGGQ